MTNKEWLDYLAHNAPDELADWFDAEHVETEERALDGDTEPQDADSREQLEADIRELMRNLYEIGYTDAKLNYGILGQETRPRLFTFDEKRCAKFIELLDRQAAITAEETSNAWEEYMDATQREITELTAERDKLQEQLRIGWECECRLQAERDELQAKVDALRSRHCPHYDATEHTCDVHRTRIAELTAEREQYRKLFGMALDWAHEITMLETSIDEGMA